MITSSLIAARISYALTKEMVNIEAAKQLAPYLLDSGRRWISEAVQRRRTQDQTEDIDDGRPKDNHSAESTEYLVHNWLEALFAWFQVVILWHEPSVSLCAITGLLSSFLFITYFAPRFYATILLAIFVFNLYKFWFRHVWPEIRVPPEKDREIEQRLDVDRWTYLHPQLMTLAELRQHVKSSAKLAEKYLLNLLELRQRKPVAFCSKICFVFVCTAIVGNTFSGLSLIFLTLIVIMTAPGIYVHLLSDDLKQWSRQALGQLSSSEPYIGPQIESDGIENELPKPHLLDTTSKKPTNYISSSLSSTTESIAQLFDTLKQRSFPLIHTERQPQAEPRVANEDDSSERSNSIDVPTDEASNRRITSESDGDRAEPRQRRRRESSQSLAENDESAYQRESDEDQQDGFVML